MPVVLISGAANGLGDAFVAAYRDQPDTLVIAIDRELPHRAPGDHNLQVFRVDVTNENSINNLVAETCDLAVDLVIHSAGVRGLVSRLEVEKHGDVPACENMEVMDLQTLTQAFQINAAGTFLLLRALLPSLGRSENAKVVIMSSRMSSLSNNFSGGAYAYRASKAALNAIVRSFVVDVPEVSFVLCHPGRVESKLVKWKEDGAITAEESVRGLLPLIEKWCKDDSGNFYDRFGKPIPW